MEPIGDPTTNLTIRITDSDIIVYNVYCYWLGERNLYRSLTISPSATAGINPEIYAGATEYADIAFMIDEDELAHWETTTFTITLPADGIYTSGEVTVTFINDTLT